MGNSTIINTAANCPSLKLNENLGFELASGMDLGDTVEYVCRRGYVLQGPKIRQCLTHGTWSGSNPTCMRKSIKE